METLKKLELVKLRVIKDFSIFAPLLADLKIEKSNNVDTLALDYQNKLILYNENFVNNVDKNELVFALAHEIMHYLLIHDARRFKDKANNVIFNIGADALINEMLKLKLGFMPDFVINLKFLKNIVPEEFENYETEDFLREDTITIYKKLLKKFGKYKQALESLANKFENGNLNEKDIDNEIDKISKDLGLNDREKEILKKTIKHILENHKEIGNVDEKTENEIKRKIEKGIVFSKAMKNRGNISFDFESLVEMFLKKKVLDWKKVLRETFSEIKSIVRDYNLLRQSRKVQILRNALGKDLFIPELKREDFDVNVVIGIDSSGSIDDNEYSEFISEVYNLMNDVKNVRGYAIVWEAEVKKIIEIKNGWNKQVFDELKKRKGYGGTIIESFFKKANELIRNKKKTYCIVFTDGYTENVRNEWVKDFKKTIFVISKNGSKDSLKDVKNLRNVLIAEMV